MKKIWIMAGESSGDMYGAELSRELRRIAADRGETVEFSGMGGAAMIAAGIPVNDSEKKELCDFWFPGVVTEGNVIVGLTASGEDHKKARRIREQITEMLAETSPEGADA